MHVCLPLHRRAFLHCRSMMHADAEDDVQCKGSAYTSTVGVAADHVAKAQCWCFCFCSSSRHLNIGGNPACGRRPITTS
jgi:hypothetical protein